MERKPYYDHDYDKGREDVGKSVRRYLWAWEQKDLANALNGAGEIKVLQVLDENLIALGFHFHPYIEMFVVVGGCTIFTWTEAEGLNMHEIDARDACVIEFEPGEEHVVVCSKGTVLFGCLPGMFKQDSMIASKHLPRVEEGRWEEYISNWKN